MVTIFGKAGNWRLDFDHAQTACFSNIHQEIRSFTHESFRGSSWKKRQLTAALPLQCRMNIYVKSFDGPHLLGEPATHPLERPAAVSTIIEAQP